jgi:hypothetical protein
MLSNASIIQENTYGGYPAERINALASAPHVNIFI